MAKITAITVLEILDSRGNPTTQATVVLDDATTATASCPSGASVGTYEAVELRDNDLKRYHGQGVLKTLQNISEVIAPKLAGHEVAQQQQIDEVLLALDGTPNKAKLGTNAILPVSIAICKAAAKSKKIALYTYIAQLCLQNVPTTIPTPLFNIINGGKHAGENIDFQEFVVIPTGVISFREKLRQGSEIYMVLKKILIEKHLPITVGDEGGFAPTLNSNQEALALIRQAIEIAGFSSVNEVAIGLDVAANSFFKNNMYVVKDKPQPLSADMLLAYYQELQTMHSFLYLEDCFAEDDWDAWVKLTATMKKPTIIVGDDLLVTNTKRLQTAIEKNAATGIIIKLNQIGTVTEAIAVIAQAKKANMKIIVSHRSGETTDDFIADFAVGVRADFAKFGAPARGERIAKYNRLLQIEQEINSKSTN